MLERSGCTSTSPTAAASLVASTKDVGKLRDATTLSARRLALATSDSARRQFVAKGVVVLRGCVHEGGALAPPPLAKARRRRLPWAVLALAALPVLWRVRLRLSR